MRSLVKMNYHQIQSIIITNVPVIFLIPKTSSVTWTLPISWYWCRSDISATKEVLHNIHILLGYSIIVSTVVCSYCSGRNNSVHRLCFLMNLTEDLGRNLKVLSRRMEMWEVDAPGVGLRDVVVVLKASLRLHLYKRSHTRVYTNTLWGSSLT